MRRPTDWTPDPDQKKRLLAFEGYGVDSPDVVFVGLEEYCSGDPRKQRDSIWIRCTHPEFAGRRADKNRALEALSGLVKTHVPVWDVMAGIISGLTGRPCYLERQELGARPGAESPLTTWLTELRPLPRPSSSGFAETYIAEWFGDHFDTEAAYIAKADASASARLPLALSSAKPKYAFFYGADSRRWAQRAFTADLLRTPFSTPFPGIDVAETVRGTKLACTHFYNGRHPTSTFGLGQVGDLLRGLRA
jgi:hypothetical protein